MKELIIDKNESEQRLDRFLKKYFSEAPQGFVYKMIRKKNIKLNGKKASPEDNIREGDIIQLYLADDTIDKFAPKKQFKKSKLMPSIIYEDENIILINKAAGILSHGTGEEFEENIVDSLISYLIQKGDYVPRIEKSFTPAICNRLDRNTSGIIIGAKNYQALKAINQSLRNGHILRKYKTIVRGSILRDIKDEAFLSKNEDRNKVSIIDEDQDGAKKIVTIVRPIKVKNGYTLTEIQLITGRTHQIRGHLSSLGFPIIGDRKYGVENINKIFREKYKLENQWLHGYKVELAGFKDELEYLNGKVFISESEGVLAHIEKDLF